MPGPRRRTGPKTSGGPHRTAGGSRARGKVRTSWEGVAEWYDGWVGPEGSMHHQKLAIPAVMGLLNLQPGERMLDIACGQGALAATVAEASGHYEGVDASPALIQKARAYHNTKAVFHIGDARKLAELPSLTAGKFDAAVFMLSIQDIDPLQPALASAAAMLKPGGRLVLLMTHPCFRIPRQSGWGYDEGRKLLFRRVDAYMSAMAIPLNEGATRSFHRPLSEYINGLGAAGLLVDAMKEIPTYKKADAKSARSQAEQRANEEFPLFLGLRARKAG